MISQAHNEVTQLLRRLLLRPEAAIMGILNVTPDSFSDGGRFIDESAALRQVELMVNEGADIVDVGGESTRPGAEQVSEQVELDRVLPVIEAIRKNFDTPISVDTSKPGVMCASMSVGAAMINDVNALQAEGAVEMAANSGAVVCLMHKQGDPSNMQDAPEYDDVVQEVGEFLQQRINACLKSGIDKANIMVDPGIGFGKTLEHNLHLLAHVDSLRAASGCDVLIGVSRKSLIDKLLKRQVSQRVSASVGLAVQAVLNGAKIVRVHDVAATYDAVRCVEAVKDRR